MNAWTALTKLTNSLQPEVFWRPKHLPYDEADGCDIEWYIRPPANPLRNSRSSRSSSSSSRKTTALPPPWRVRECRKFDPLSFGTAETRKPWCAAERIWQQLTTRVSDCSRQFFLATSSCPGWKTSWPRFLGFALNYFTLIIFLKITSD